MNQLNNTQVLKVKNSTLKLEIDFKPINISINGMDKFDIKELTRIDLVRLVRLVN